jgi:extracellular factor (EF) 3-hydroxypalmitic acid methyl ester biosynthesis protein
MSQTTGGAPQYCERRVFPRHPCSIRLDEFRVIRDLSLGGAFVEGPPPAGRELFLQFTLPDPPQDVGAKGKVVFQGASRYGQGFGLEFLDLDRRSKLLLQVFFQNLVGESEERGEARDRLVAATEAFLQKFPAEFQDIRPDFKKTVSDFRAYLLELKRHLQEAERDCAELGPSDREKVLRDLLHFYERDFQNQVHRFLLDFSRIIREFGEGDHRLHRKYFQTLLTDLTGDSLFFRRAMEKPLGYAGDYVMMELLYTGLRAGRSLWEKTINSCLTSIPLGQAVRNRAWYLKEWIDKMMAAGRSKETPKILSLACGPCEEISLLIRHRPDLRAEFFLIDQDPRALAHAEERLTALQEERGTSHTFHFLNDSTRNFLKEPDHVKKYPLMNLIYTAGLYDYLKEETARALTGVLYQMLEPNGMLVLGNFTKGNPFAYFIEYASDWFLFHRSPEDMLSLAPLCLEGDQKWVEREASGVNLFLCLRKPMP